MQKKFFKYLFFILVLFTISCARRGTITGGLKDTIAPIMKSSLPKNFSTNFNGKEIKIYFDEYVKLKNANKQLIISPPMKRTPEILPYNASKYITIKLKDTLLENTTYSFNFGQSIEDNNEGNKLQQFKYVFSTGNYIDSLALNAKIKDAYQNKVDNFVSIMLYEVNDKYNDSTVYKEVPRYITSTLDSLKIVKLENLKEGKYQLIALKDENGNNKFDPKTDKIGFQKEYITIPNDTLYQLELFKEELPYKALNASQAAHSKLAVGYEGNPKDLKITVKKGSEILPSIITKFPKKDSLQVWVKTIKDDSLSVEVSKDKFNKSFALKIKEQKKDTLSFVPEQRGTLSFRDKFTITSGTPIISFDESKMKLLSKDSSVVKFTTEYDEYNQKLKFNFKKEPLEKYNFTLFPGALTDYYQRQNDTLTFRFNTNDISDYGNLNLTLQNVKRFPVIVELTDKDGKMVYSEYSEKETVFHFDLIEPNKYSLRIIYDDNKNKVWDPGCFIEHRQSEEVIYFPSEIELKANWDWEQVFDVGVSN